MPAGISAVTSDCILHQSSLWPTSLLQQLVPTHIRVSYEDPHSENRQLTIRCFGVTGFADGEAEPAVEDEITIAFRSQPVFEAMFPSDRRAEPVTGDDRGKADQ